MKVTSEIEYRTLLASNLRVGDTIANVGTVQATTFVGAFVVVQLFAPTWSLATGRAVTVMTERVFCKTDFVTVETFAQ